MATDTSTSGAGAGTASPPPSYNQSQSQSQEKEKEQEQEPIEMTCQCGQISLLLPYPPKRILECQCSICFRYGGLWSYYPRSKVLVTAAMGALRPTGSETTSGLEGSTGGEGGEGADSKKKAKAVSTADMEGKGASTRKYIREGERMGFIEFHFCAKCGCVTHWWGVEREDGNEKMGVNVRMLGVERLKGVKRRVSKGPD